MHFKPTFRLEKLHEESVIRESYSVAGYAIGSPQNSDVTFGLPLRTNHGPQSPLAARTDRTTVMR